MKGIKRKLLVSLNGASEKELNNALLNNYKICSLSNKENNWTIILVVLLFKNNIPWTDPMCEHLWHYKDLPNKKEFQRIRNYKYWPSKLEVEGIVHGTILCWFYIMQAFEENLKTLNIPAK
ncbi:hypothetical protein C2G38_2044334 [Gigaspora rosea]|uniref:Uncharacterized protein n=1 Tax=Gigaspora rosea TaxID=44941 RepID=A0A397UPT1_9GLOM|nr:hypothetical protein C2G38_2044334 [Gigaspora rosea]